MEVFLSPIRVFVGTDTSQLLAVKVLEYSIKRRTDAAVEVVAMCDLPIREPKDPRQRQRTGFSFSRFAIPELAQYTGKALYMDADMLVLRDIRELWQIPFGQAKILIQKPLEQGQSQTTGKAGAPKVRIRQCAVMLLDCGQLSWKVDEIIDLLDREIMNYEQLIYELKILKEEEIGEAIPFQWNSLETLEPTTGNIHYTDMDTQPWVSCFNKNSQVWFDEVRHMIESGALSWEDVRAEIQKGYFRPSLIRDIRYRYLVPGFLRKSWDTVNAARDKSKGFVKHKQVYEAKRKRGEAISRFAEAQSSVESQKPFCP
jgi:lipopolysaccharide biosynthesis glycosyltransferase